MSTAASAQCFTPNQLQKSQHAPPTGGCHQRGLNFKDEHMKMNKTDGLSIQKWSWDTWSGNQKYIHRGKLIKYHSAAPGFLVPRCFFASTSGVSAPLHPQPPYAKHRVPQKFWMYHFLGVPGGLCQDCVQHMSESNQGRLAKYERQHPCQTIKKFYDNWSFDIALDKMCVIMCVYVQSSEFQFYLVGGFYPCKTSSNWQSSPSRDEPSAHVYTCILIVVIERWESIKNDLDLVIQRISLEGLTYIVWVHYFRSNARYSIYRLQIILLETSTTSRVIKSKVHPKKHIPSHHLDHQRPMSLGPAVPQRNLKWWMVCQVG